MALHRSLLEFEVMSSTPPHAGVIDFNFGADFGDFGGDFGASFGIDVYFGGGFGNFAFADFFGDSVTSDFEVDSCGSFASDDTGGHRRRKIGRQRRRSNRLFRVESVKKSCWYRNFTAPGKIRDLTHELSSSDRFGEFRHFFRMPLSKVEELTEKLITRGYVRYPRTRCRQAEFRERTELLVMSSLYLLGTGAAFRACRSLCSISTSEVQKFFYVFLDAIVDMKDEYVYMPRNITELNRVSNCYGMAGLPGCMGSIDVVHVKWANCPAGDFNRAKGKETFPSLGFQCITDFNRRVLSIYGPHFGSRNDMDIVKTDEHVEKVKTKRLFRDAQWTYYNQNGQVRQANGMYLICDNGYLRWPTTICPFTRTSISSPEGYFSTNIESVRKDVECTFGIIKKRWRILNNGFYQRDMVICDKIFVTCCCLNNFMLDLMEKTNVRVGRGHPMGDDGIWLSGPRDVEPEETDRLLSMQFEQRRFLLVNHLYLYRKLGNISGLN